MADMNTPWRVEADEINYEARGKLTSDTHIAGYNIYTADGDEVVGCEGIIDLTSDRADFMVHCVNSHASLVEENKRMREALMGMVKACQSDGDWAGKHFLSAYDLWQSYLFAKEALGDSNA